MIHFGNLLKLSVLFLIIIDPIGNSPLFISVLKQFEIKQQRKIIFREMSFALLIMCLFLFFGNMILDFLSVDHQTLRVTGGIILFLIALQMIFSAPHANNTGSTGAEPFIVPLAIPAVAGPGALAAIALYGANPDYGAVTVLLAVCIAWVISLFPLLYAPYLKKILSQEGLIAVERIFGFLVVLISIEMIVKGTCESLQCAL